MVVVVWLISSGASVALVAGVCARSAAIVDICSRFEVVLKTGRLLL